MKYVILFLILACSAAFADTSAPVGDRQKGPNDQTFETPATDNAHRNINTAQGNVLPNSSHHVAVVPSEIMSAPQYQPQPLPQNSQSPLYSLPSH